MPTGTFQRPWLVANNGGWAETFNFFVGGAGSPDDITGCTATLNLIRPGRPTAEVLTYNAADDPSYVTVIAAPASVTLGVPASVTADWTPGVYDVQLRVYAGAGGVDRYNLVGPGRLTVIEAPGT